VRLRCLYTRSSHLHAHPGGLAAALLTRTHDGCIRADTCCRASCRVRGLLDGAMDGPSHKSIIRRTCSACVATNTLGDPSAAVVTRPARRVRALRRSVCSQSHSALRLSVDGLESRGGPLSRVRLASSPTRGLIPLPPKANGSFMKRTSPSEFVEVVVSRKRLAPQVGRVQRSGRADPHTRSAENTFSAQL
jgi:hypothetical protein